jgi:hypothetical protein
MDATTSLDAVLRRDVYAVVLSRGSPPTIAELAAASRASAEDVRASLARLAAARVVVLQPASGEILMAPPFSAVPTSFLVRTRQYDAYANCAWDALGVPVMLGDPAHIISACGCCGEALALHTKHDGAPQGAAVVHFAVPARRWWDDIVFT